MDTQRGRTGTPNCHARCAEAEDQHRPACGFGYRRYLAYSKVVVPLRDPEVGDVKIVAAGKECGILCSATVVGVNSNELKVSKVDAASVVKVNDGVAGISIYRDRNTVDGKKV